MKRTPAPRKGLEGVEAYREEATAPLNLSNNTSLFEPNPAFAEAIESFDPATLPAYPSLDSAALREAAARTHGLKPEQVVTGNGSNDLLDLLVRTFGEPGDRVAWHPPSFEMIPVFARAAGCEPWPVPLRGARFALDADAFIAARAKVAVVCRPNNPTGAAFPRADVERVVAGSEGLVVVDEAYEDFLGDSLAPLVREAPNLAVIRTLSKAQGLAALRVGYALCPEPVARALEKVRGPFRLGALGERVAVRALARTDYTRRVVEEVRRERARLARELGVRGFRVLPSDANFLLLAPPRGADELHAALLRRGVALRKFAAPELRGWLRCTVGPAWVTERLLAELDEALREVGP